MAGNPIVLGTMLAALAALAFGATTPFIQRLGAGVGPFTTAALLYLGAAIGAFSLPGRKAEQRHGGLLLRWPVRVHLESSATVGSQSGAGGSADSRFASAYICSAKR